MNDKKWFLIFGCWLVAAISTAGSLFFSEVMRFPPCTLCWYQRILMYPLVIIFLMGLIPFDRSVIKFSLPLTVLGWLIAIYHNLLYYKILPESAAPCVMGISCTTVQIEWFGFITIPFLSLTAFTLILILLTFSYRILNREK
ncbi:MAG: disulfide oxidoreductase [Bacteriovoracaceae bacterium]|nr:disulfide oxidoreductase [Bacteriovoracaceae bacterium]